MISRRRLLTGGAALGALLATGATIVAQGASWVPGGNSSFVDQGTVLGSGAIGSGGTQVQSPVSLAQNTMGTWVQLVASTPSTANKLIVTVKGTQNATQNNPAGYKSVCVNIGIGTSGSQTILIPGLICCYGGQEALTWIFPINLPAGTTLWAQMQSNYTPTVVEVGYVQVTLVNDPWQSGFVYNTVTSYGVNLATSLGTPVDAGATANTLGAWTQITASCSGMSAFLLTMDNSFPGSESTQHTGSFLLNIGTGASGSETILIPNILDGASLEPATTINFAYMVRGPFYFPIPGGTRIAVQAQGTLTIAAARVHGISIHGLS